MYSFAIGIIFLYINCSTMRNRLKARDAFDIRINIPESMNIVLRAALSARSLCSIFPTWDERFEWYLIANRALRRI